jgi:purine-nucleoside/S-methyl-5'-thioadenosine phosphorylase / adenosine deaminase
MSASAYLGPHSIVPHWPAPPNVRAATTLRTGGVSVGSFASLNLGAHVGDDPQAVAENRRRVREALELPAEPVWLNQVHGTTVIGAVSLPAPPTADASISDVPGQVCAVLTADCLPVLICDQAGTRVAAVHAGWRGLSAGVLRATVEALSVPSSRLLAWLGPAIEQDAFEVGPEVRERFLDLDPEHDRSFVPNERGRWQADLYALARRELGRLGITDVFGGGYRCYSDAERFFSYRRDSQTGRMASLIWLTS